MTHPLLDDATQIVQWVEFKQISCFIESWMGVHGGFLVAKYTL